MGSYRVAVKFMDMMQTPKYRGYNYSATATSTGVPSQIPCLVQ